MASDEAREAAYLRSESTNRRLYGRALNLEAQVLRASRRIAQLELALMRLAAQLHDRPGSARDEMSQDAVEAVQVTVPATDQLDRKLPQVLDLYWSKAVERYRINSETEAAEGEGRR